MKIGIFSGSFDPITNGHIDLINRSSKFFDRIVVAVLVNRGKNTMFSSAERVEFIKKSLEVENVEVIFHEGLMTDLYTQYSRLGSVVVIRGVRSFSDFEYESRMFDINHKLLREFEEFLMIAKPEFANISSSIVKELASFGSDIRGFVPEIVARELRAKFM